MPEIRTFRGKYYFLSNFYPCRIELEGIVYPSSEHAYQAYKTDNYKLRQKIAEQSSPALAKLLGRRFRLRPDWETVKVPVMLNILRVKFRNPTLRQKLADTDQAELIEGNTWGDTFWGVCKGKGENKLGQLLMKVRQEILNG